MIYMTKFAFTFLLCSLYLLNGVASYSLRSTFKINYATSIRTAAKNVLPPIDEIVDISEIFHDPLIAYHLDGISKRFNSQRFLSVIPQLKSLFLVDKRIAMSILIFCFSYTHILMFLYYLTSINKKSRMPFEKTIFGYLLPSFRNIAYFFPVLYLVDIVTILAHALGFDFHIKGGLPLLFCQLYYYYITGSFVTQLKDWFVQTKFRKFVNSGIRDTERERTIDELSSIFIWSIFLGLGIETLSLKLGFALGSLLTLGGIGSASLILALRGTMENMLAGISMKIQDKYRVGEVISLPKQKEEGVIEEITYFDTKIRKEDNSIICVPNNIFSEGEVLNWSRTPYRLFKTQVNVPLESLKNLSGIINNLTSQLKMLEGVESQQRKLLVSASGFDKDKIIIDVCLHFSSSGQEETAKIRTKITNLIGDILNTNA